MSTRHIYDVCKPIRMFGGVYAKDTYDQAVKQAKPYIVNTDPSWSPGGHWFVVDHRMNPVLSSTLVVLGARRLLQSFGSEPLVQPIFNNVLQGLTTNVCGDYCIFYVFFACKG